jgi:hypothetical protein
MGSFDINIIGNKGREGSIQTEYRNDVVYAWSLTWMQEIVVTTHIEFKQCKSFLYIYTWNTIVILKGS